MEGMISEAEAQDLLNAVLSRLNATMHDLFRAQAALSKEMRASAEKDKRIAELEGKLSSTSS